MTSHNHVNFPLVSEMNKKEYEANAKWMLKYDPTGRRSRLLLQAASPGLSGPELRTHLHRCHSTNPDSSAHRSALASPSEQQATVSSSAVSPTGSKTYHCRRKHRPNCPKHLLNLQRMAAEASSNDVSATVSSEPQSSHKTSANMPKPNPLTLLAIPHCIGKGLPNLVSGGYVQQYSVKESTTKRLHADFRANELKQNEAVLRNEGRFSPLMQLYPLSEEVRVADAKDFKYHRTKYEIKTHMEAMMTSAGQLLRDLSGGAFK